MLGDRHKLAPAPKLQVTVYLSSYRGPHKTLDPSSLSAKAAFLPVFQVSQVMTLLVHTSGHMACATSSYAQFQRCSAASCCLAAGVQTARSWHWFTVWLWMSAAACLQVMLVSRHACAAMAGPALADVIMTCQGRCRGVQLPLCALLSSAAGIFWSGSAARVVSCQHVTQWMDG